MEGKQTEVEKLLAAGADVNARTSGGMTALVRRARGRGRGKGKRKKKKKERRTKPARMLTVLGSTGQWYEDTLEWSRL